MTHAHTDVISELTYRLRDQIDRREFRVHVEGSRTKIRSGTYFVPDIAVVPTHLTAPHYDERKLLESYDEPLPLVVEVWSTSTGTYDVTAKLPEYRGRGDLEVWLVHPYDRTIRAWRRQPDGTYAETLHERGAVPVASLPSVVVKIEELFD